MLHIFKKFSFLLFLSASLSGIVTKAYAYDRVQLNNFSTSSGFAEVEYLGCKPDYLNLTPAIVGRNGIQPSSSHGPVSRGGCLVTKISAYFGEYVDANGKPYVFRFGGPQPVWKDDGIEVNSYNSSGTSYVNFTIVQRSEKRFRIMSDAEIKRDDGDGNMSPGFKIYNRSQIPLTVSLEQIGCLYYQNNLPPGGTFERNTGAVWFTIRAKLFDANHPITNQDCAKPIEILFGTAILSVVAPAAGGALYAALFGGAEVASVAAASTAAAVEAGAVTAADVATTTAVSATTMESAAAATNSLVAKAALALSKGAAGAGLDKIVQGRLEANISTSLAGQYAGPPWPFRCTRKPEYEIYGGPDFSKLSQYKTVEEVQQAIIDALSGDSPLKFKKLNNCGNGN